MEVSAKIPQISTLSGSLLSKNHPKLYNQPEQDDLGSVMNSIEIGSRIKQERKRQKLTQEQLAALAGVGVRFIRELEHGKPTCQLSLALQIMQTLGLSLKILTSDDRPS